ncbi:MAG: glycerophosphodiester phosphodiesterase [Calditrichaeota bacterium]|nr:MAG: glycerophosphodiester phosphodiesterase [Calditrichota bacterium]
MANLPTGNLLHQPLIFAHRGANSFAPENSLPAIEAALKLGCHGVEVDLRLTASGDVIVFHDRKLTRMTGCRGNVHQLSLDAIRQCYLEQNRNYIIPTLQEVLELVRDNSYLILDVKKESMRNNGLEEKILNILKAFNLKDNIIISSFNPLVLKKFYHLAPEYRLGFIYRQRSHKFLSNGTPIDSLHVYHRVLSRKYIHSLKERGFKIFAWTVDKERHFKRMLKIGVDGIITNRPEVFFNGIMEPQLLQMNSNR